MHTHETGAVRMASRRGGALNAYAGAWPGLPHRKRLLPVPGWLALFDTTPSPTAPSMQARERSTHPHPLLRPPGSTAHFSSQNPPRTTALRIWNAERLSAALVSVRMRCCSSAEGNAIVSCATQHQGVVAPLTLRQPAGCRCQAGPCRAAQVFPPPLTQVPRPGGGAHHGGCGGSGWR